MSDEKTFASAKEIKVGKYLIIDGVPCRVVDLDISKSGKHGAAKMRITGIGVFNGEKKVMLTPGDGDVEIPMIGRKDAQVVSVSGDSLHLMDTQTYEIFELPIPPDLEGTPEPGKTAEILEAMGKRKVIKVR